MSDQDVHDLRGEVGGIRSDIRALATKVDEGFEAVYVRVHALEVKQIEDRVRRDVHREMLASGQIANSYPAPPAPPIHKDPRTYAIGGSAVALAGIVYEVLGFLRALWHIPPPQ